MSYILTIIDMQPLFPAARSKSVLLNCQFEIGMAINNNAHIIFLEYEGCGNTIKFLNYLPNKINYSKTYKTIKKINDGSGSILSLMRKKKIPRTDFRVCGINTDCCVFETVGGLDRKLPKGLKVKVVKKACGSEYSHKEGIKDISSISNRVLVV